MEEDISFDIDNQSNFSYSLSSFEEEHKTLFQHSFKNINLKKYFFICPDCSKTPLIDLTNDLIIIKCQDPKHANPAIIKIKELKDKEKVYLFSEEDTSINIDCMKCDEHKAPYFYYCNHKTCRKNVCKQDYNFHSKKHIQDLYGFGLLFSELKETIKDIKEIFKLENFEDKDDLKSYDILKLLIISILYNFSIFPNFNLYENIISIYKFSKQYVNSKENNEDIKKEIRIITSRELEDIIEQKKDNKEDLKYIEYIRIYQSNFQKIEILNENQKYLKGLKELALEQNNIKSIENLIKVYFPNLEKLSLRTNIIGDENITFFKMFKNNFPKLKDLSLEGNNITDYNFFDSIQTLNDLMVLNVSRNPFYSTNIPNKKYIFKSMKELILSNGVFRNKTIKIIQNFDIKNIEKIDLSSNKLKTLDFIGNVQWPELNTLLLNGNNISKIEILQKFQNLKLLEIKDNLISDRKELKKLTEYNPDLHIYSSLNKFGINNINNNNSNNNIIINERLTKINSNNDSDDD